MTTRAGSLVYARVEYAWAVAMELARKYVDLPIISSFDGRKMVIIILKF